MPVTDPPILAYSNTTNRSGRQSALMRVAGGLGLAGILIGLTILVLSCGGLEGALTFSMLPVAMGIAGAVISLVASWRVGIGTPESPALASLFVAFLAIIGGLLEAAAWLRWPIFFNQSP